MKALKIIRNNWIIIWLMVISFSLASVFSYAAYTGTTTAKRVISLKSGDSILFSSRYMFRTGTEIEPILFSFEEGTIPSAPVVVVDVCNYDANGNIYGRNLHFKFKARLVHRNGSDITATEWNALTTVPMDYTVSYKSHTGSSTASYPDAQALTLTYQDQYIIDSADADIQFLCSASDKTRYLFETKYPVSDITGSNSAYGIRIEAEVVESYSDMDSIWGMLRVMNGGTGTRDKWEGKFMDDTTNNKKPSDYDGINYQISGNAEGTVTITYRSDCVEIDKDDLTTLGTVISSETPADSNGVKYKSLEFEVNPEDNSVFNMKFYWVIDPSSAKATSLIFNTTEDDDNVFISTAFEG